MRDIGRTFDGRVLTPTDYQRAEDAYVATALAFLVEAGITSMRIAFLEKSKSDGDLGSVSKQ